MKKEYLYSITTVILIIVLFVVKKFYEPGIYSNENFSKFIDLKNVTKIEIQTAKTKGVFEKKDKNWYMTEPFYWNANSSEISSLLNNLETSKIYGPLTENQSIYEKFEITQNSPKITLHSNKTLSFLIGKDGQSFRSVFIKFNDKKPVYELNGISPFDIKREPFDLILKNLITSTDEEVESITFTLSKKDYNFSKKDNNWSDPKGKEIYSKLKELRFDEITQKNKNNTTDFILKITLKSNTEIFNFIKDKNTYIAENKGVVLKFNEYYSKKISEIKELVKK